MAPKRKSPLKENTNSGGTPQSSLNIFHLKSPHTKIQTPSEEIEINIVVNRGYKKTRWIVEDLNGNTNNSNAKETHL